jgi:hypothetical protein
MDQQMGLPALEVRNIPSTIDCQTWVSMKESYMYARVDGNTVLDSS